jgi:hypothetical protein
MLQTTPEQRRCWELPTTHNGTPTTHKPGAPRGVITQPFWHVRFPRGTLEGAFGSSVTTGGFLRRCRYDLPPESLFFSILGVKRAKGAKNFR